MDQLPSVSSSIVVLYAGSINMTNAVDSVNVENIVEGSRGATALASHAGIPEPLVLRFEECGGSLPPGGSLWREEYQGGAASTRSTELRVCPRGLVETILRNPGLSAALVGGS